jgi:hypothetical protein
MTVDLAKARADMIALQRKHGNTPIGQRANMVVEMLNNGARKSMRRTLTELAKLIGGPGE